MQLMNYKAFYEGIICTSYKAMRRTPVKALKMSFLPNNFIELRESVRKSCLSQTRGYR